MTIIINRQFALKPQDLFVLLAMLSRGEPPKGYAELATITGLAVSAVHASLKRAIEAKLVSLDDGRPVVRKSQLKEFMLYGAKYAFPAVWGALTRGLPTAYAAAPLNGVIASSNDPVPVWPHPNGPTRGMSLAPLYPSAPEAAMQNDKLYAMLSLFDALRTGQARERNAAKELLEKYFV
jgi:hypothetical protein